MCIAIMKPENISIPKDTLAQCFKANSDGAGFMYRNSRKQLQVRKGYFTFDEFWKAYEPLQKKQMAIHFRIKTHGPVDKDNCHPFLVDSKLGFIHNGIIKGYQDGTKSDTWQFNEEILQPFVNKWGRLGLFDNPVKKLIEDYIGYSKLVFMDNEGNYQIFNENKGIWEEGVWYSNSSFRKPAPLPAVAVPSYPQSHYYDYATSYRTYSEKKSEVEIGALVYFTKSFYDYTLKRTVARDSVWEIVAVNSDYSIDLMQDVDVDDNVEFLYNIPLWAIDIFNPYLMDIDEYNKAIPIEQGELS